MDLLPAFVLAAWPAYLAIGAAVTAGYLERNHR